MNAIPRLNRLLGPDGRCFDVAIDHGFFNERSFLNNIEEMRQPFYCVTPEETEQSHRILTAALASQQQTQVIQIKAEG